MKVLITGAAGFLGSHLTKRFLLENYEVIAVDDLSTGSLSNLRHHLDNPAFRFIQHDIRIPIDLEFDAVLNFACPASPVQYQIDPVRTIETNFLGVINLLRAARERGALILQASTSEVYGDPQITPQNELYWGHVNPIGIRSCYDEGKRAAETLCFDYMRQYNVDTRVVRIFNTYGPNMAVGDGRVVSNFVVQALKGIPLTIYGDGLQTRSFCYVDDLVEGIFRVFSRKTGLDSPINLGNPAEYSMLELAETVNRVVGSTSQIVFESLPLDDPKQRNPDISKAKSILGWSPEISLDDGVYATAEYFRNVLEL
jgi:UDP-glucuronate decarboxylase